MKSIQRGLFLLAFILGVFVQAQQKTAQKEYDLPVMPLPQKAVLEDGFFLLDQEFEIHLGKDQPGGRVEEASIRFLRNLTDRSGVFLKSGFPLIAEDTDGPAKNGAKVLHIAWSGTSNLAIDSDESYSLDIGSQKIVITAKTDVGALHALNTLLQLLKVEEGVFGFPALHIEDAPRFVWRGLMMDVSRHFMPVEVVKRNLEAMAYVKLNVFHWHLSDDQGFRLEMKKLPKLHELASDGLYYTQEQVAEIVEFAGQRGIRVVPEIDVPGHATAILTAYPEFASDLNRGYKVERNSGIFDPTLNPTNEALYPFMDALFGELSQLFPDPYVHIGGDENEGKQWDANPDIQKFMKEKRIQDNHQLQTYFNIRLEKILAKYDKKLMGWEEIMTKDMPTSALIHSWRGVNEGVEPGQSLVEAAQRGYYTILSNGYYIDLMLSVEEHYLVDPMPEANLSPEEKERILGGEATMWSELVTPFTVDGRIWPRTAAIAERFWSAKEVVDLESMHQRMQKISGELEWLGLKHLHSKNVILKNLANQQDITGLLALTEISEPYKIYSRNAGGTQYQSYSPFTLFVDACFADAADKISFRKALEVYEKDPSAANKKALLRHFEKWKRIPSQLKSISATAPLLNPVLPYADRVGTLSALMHKALKDGHLTRADEEKIRQLLERSEDPSKNLDVDFAVKKEVLILVDMLSKGRLNKS